VDPHARIPFLVIEDDRPLARSLDRFLRRFGDVEVTHSVREARERIATGRLFRGIVFDVRLPDGSGLDLLAEIRRGGNNVPALVLTAVNDPAVPRDAQLHRALFLPKPPGEDHLAAFVEWAEAPDRQPRDKLEREVDRLVEHFKLSEREKEILLLAARGFDRIEISDELGVEPSTVKTTVRRLLRKTGHNTLADLVTVVLRAVFLGVK
jgi:DNA-binding NarL/FixJ family response regulator